MTCIIGYEYDGDVYIGSDSAVSDSWTISSLAAKEKVFINGGIIWGCCGSPRVSQLLHYALEVPEVDEDQSDMAYLVINLIDAIRNLLKEKGSLYDSSDNHIQQLPWSALVIGYNGKIYVIDSDFQVSRSNDGFSCEGSGKEVAIGAMQILKNDNQLTAEDKIKKALEASAHHTCFVRGPFHVLRLLEEEE